MSEAEALELLHRDEALVAISKPSGAVVHRTRGLPAGSMLLVQTLRDQLGQRVYPVHRLDRQTSGVLVFALSSEDAAAMAADLQSGQWRKRYLGLARGPLREPFDVDYAVPEDDKRREARTSFDPVETFCDRYTLVAGYPHTGRYHQLRRHLKHLKHPLVGDTNYGDSKVNRLFRREFGLHRLFLHAESLELPHPKELRRLTLRCPLSAELQRCLEALRSYDGPIA
jgi:tRNA pseudouridine65 synthase